MAELRWKKGMGPLDFSCFHDTLVEDFDGNVQPMDEPYFKATEIAPDTWQILSQGDFQYVIAGDDEAIVIDSGNGCGNLREFVKTLVPGKKVYRLFNTHNHADHTVNNYQFDVTYMSEKCYEGRATMFMDWLQIEEQIPKDYPVVFLKDGDVINLKGRPIEVYNIEEHCMGSLQFLDRKNRIFFVGDELNDHFFDSRISVEHSYRNLKRWASLRDAYDIMCAGNGIADAVYVDRYLQAAEYILSGHENEGEEWYVPYEDHIASAREKDGKKLITRRGPNMEDLCYPLIEAGYGKAVELNHGRGCFCLMRKLGPDGPFDRQLEKFDCKFCYYVNRIWDK